jgi:hypothetical protein
MADNGGLISVFLVGENSSIAVTVFNALIPGLPAHYRTTHVQWCGMEQVQPAIIRTFRGECDELHVEGTPRTDIVIVLMVLAGDGSISDDARLWLDEVPRALCWYWSPDRFQALLNPELPRGQVVSPGWVNSGYFSAQMWDSLRARGVALPGNPWGEDVAGLRHLTWAH